MSDVMTWVEAHPVGAAIIAVFALVALVILLYLLRAVRRAAGRFWAKHVAPRPAEDRLTIAVAAIATGVSAQGMWQFAGDVLGLDGPLRLLLFAFIELAIMTSAVRAKRNMRDNFSAGIDGLAVWVLAVLTAVLSAMEALLREGADISAGTRVAEFIFRLAAPLVAAWLWERGMAIERHRLTGGGRINWRFTPERVMVKLGLAEAKDRTASEVDVHRRLTRVALAAKRVHQLRTSGGKARSIASAVARRDRALDQAVEHTDLASSAVTRARLLDIATALGGGDDLTSILATAPAAWAHDDHPAVTGQQRHSEARELAASLDRWTATTMTHRDPEVSAAIKTMADYITMTPIVTPSEVIGKVMNHVTDDVMFVPPGWTSAGSPGEETVTPDMTPIVTSPMTSDEVNEEVTKTATMRAHWDAEVAQGRYPRPSELARHADADPALASRLRATWVEELTGWAKRKATRTTGRKAVS